MHHNRFTNILLKLLVTLQKKILINYTMSYMQLRSNDLFLILNDANVIYYKYILNIFPDTFKKAFENCSTKHFVVRNIQSRSSIR